MKRADGIGRRVQAWLREAFLAPLMLYRRFLSPLVPARCKYYPTCSTYTVQAVRELGVVRGTIVAGWRLARCNPWSHGGVDELADRKIFRRRNPDCKHDHGRVPA